MNEKTYNVLFSLQRYPGNIQDERFCAELKSTSENNGCSIFWLFRDNKPKGSGLFIDVSECQPTQRSKNIIPKCRAERWIVRLALRYGLPQERARKVFYSLEAQYDRILGDGLFQVYLAWSILEPVAGIGKEVADFYGIPTANLEAGLCRNNYRIDIGDSYSAENKLPDNIDNYAETGGVFFREYSQNFFDVHGKASSQKPTKSRFRTSKKLKVLFADLLVTDCYEYPYGKSELFSDLYGEGGMLGLASAASVSPDLEVKLRPHPLIAKSIIYKDLKAHRRLVDLRGNLQSFIEEADLVVVSNSKSMYQAILSGKPTMVVGHGFFYGNMVTYVNKNIPIGQFLKDFTLSYDYTSQHNKLCSIVGYLVTHRWPFFGETTADLLGFQKAIRDLTERLSLRKAETIEPNSLFLENFERLIGKNNQTRKFNSRKFLLRELIRKSNPFS